VSRPMSGAGKFVMPPVRCGPPLGREWRRMIEGVTA
jgi:hypothetical protein